MKSFNLFLDYWIHLISYIFCLINRFNKMTSLPMQLGNKIPYSICPGCIGALPSQDLVSRLGDNRSHNGEPVCCNWQSTPFVRQGSKVSKDSLAQLMTTVRQESGSRLISVDPICANGLAIFIKLIFLPCCAY